VGNKTIYVKNEELWETAKSLAGKAGLSGFIEEALEQLVAAKQLKQKGLKRFHVRLVEPDEWGDDPTDEIRHIGFDGKRLVDRDELSVYLTKVGKFIVTDNRLDAGISGYRTYDQCVEVRKDEAITALEKDEQIRIWNSIVEGLPPDESFTWID